MNKKGQAFSTFQLLIAAVVAVVILVILLSILKIIDPWSLFFGDPIQVTSNAVRDAVSTQLTPITTKVVRLTENYTLTSKAIANSAKASGITDEQICLSLGDFSGADGWVGGEGDKDNIIIYKNRGEKSIRLTAFCSVAKELKENMEFYYAEGEGELNPEWVSHCSCITEHPEEICCVVALRYAR